MVRGFFFALTACFIWGWIFVIPQFLEGFSVLEICLGRYFVYGILSLGILLKDLLSLKPYRYGLSIWRRALFFSLSCTIVYYTCVILALRHSKPAICSLILGISPIAIAFLGNWKTKEAPFKSFILPSLFILSGLALIHVPHLGAADSPIDDILGLFFCLIALIAWSWYVVANSAFLKKHPHIVPQDWSTLIGVSTLFWVMICICLIALAWPDQLQWQKYGILNEGLLRYLAGCTFLGVFCSWLGGYLWNLASRHLPVSLTGYLTIFETVFSLIFIYSVSQTFPPLLECLAIAFFFTAVSTSFHQLRKLQPAPTK
jgi:drug/metabolite transporter (DMT)-like permease